MQFPDKKKIRIRGTRAVFLASLFVLQILLTAGAAPSWAQMNTGEITGAVNDATGAAIAGAEVTASNAATQQRFDAATNQNGEYFLSQLPPGSYQIAADAPGFKQALAQNVVVHVNDHLRQDFTLQVGDQKASVIVQALPGLVQAESAEIKDVIQSQQVQDLPLKDREFLQLTLLSEGVVNPPGGTRGDALQQTGMLINVLGQRTGHNLFLVDGVSVTDAYFNNVVLDPSPDSISEFMMDKTNYSAEFGGRSGGVVNIITKSGTDHLHGSAYEFVRNNIFDAKNFFAPPGPAPAFQENQFGAAAGGPLVKHRIFFFADYDGQRRRESLTELFSVPTMAERSGDFAGLAAIFDPVTRQPMPGNNIANDPALHLDPAALALIRMLPQPTAGLAGQNNLLSVEEQSYDNNEYNARLDLHFTDRDSGFVRGSLFDANERDPFGSSVLNEALLPGFGRTLATHSVNLAASETHTFSANTVNEFRFGWLRVSGGQGDPHAGNPFASEYGLEGVTTNPADTGYPQISLSNAFSTIGSAAGFTSRVDRDFELFENVVMHRDTHTIQFGAYFFHLSFNPLYPNDARGVYTYSGTYTGNPLADFLLGYPSQAQAGIGRGAENATTNWGHVYAEDRWQIQPNVTMDAGLRYEYNGNLAAQANQTSDIDLFAPGGPAFIVAGNPANLAGAAAGLASSSPIPILPASSVGWNSSLLAPRYFRFSPRLGVAWRIPGAHETVVRSGFGIYTNQAAYSILQNLAENIPFYLVKLVTNSSGAPAFTTENILAQNTTGAMGANGVNHNYQVEYNEVWNFAVQRALSANMSVEAEYIGSRTVHADSATDVNVPLPGPGSVAARRPYPELAPFTTIRWDGWATFNAVTLKVTRRFSSGLSFDAEYTRSKSIDDASDTGTTNAEYNLPQNPYDPGLEAGLSSFDHRNRFTANAVYDFPFARRAAGWRRHLLADWRGSGILILQSGAPFTVNLSAAQDVANVGLVSGNNLERPNVIANPNDGPHAPAEWFNTSAFALPAPFTLGNAGRNIVTGPGFQDLDLSLERTWSITESRTVQFRCDAFNALNHPNFNLPGRILGAANFGVITSAQSARELQFAVKWMF